jgi:hypothetical protein
LTHEAIKQNIANCISRATIGRFLNEFDIKPHRSTYWLNPKIENNEVFKQEVNKICSTYHRAPEGMKNDVRTVSVDEKTGIQALERIAEHKPMKPGLIQRIESE